MRNSRKIFSRYAKNEKYFDDKSFAVIYIALLILATLLSYLIKNYALKHSLLDEVNERSSHNIPTPHGGGVAIAIVWFGGLFYLYFSQQIDPDLFYALLGGIVISAVGLIDDLFDLPAKIRLIIQALVGCFALVCLGGLESISLGFLSISNPIVTNFVAFLLIIWYINLTNFLDGINGYVGSEFVFLGLSGLVFFGDSLFGVLAVAVLGFLFFNYNKAQIFMGDVGSTLLGYNIALITLYYANQEASNLWIWIILFGVFWYDATVTLWRRIKNKEKLSQGHKKHAYQRLTQARWSHMKVTNAMLVINFVLFALIFLKLHLSLAFVVAMLVLFVCMKFVDYKKPFSYKLNFEEE